MRSSRYACHVCVSEVGGKSSSHAVWARSAGGMIIHTLRAVRQPCACAAWRVLPCSELQRCRCPALWVIQLHVRTVTVRVFIAVGSLVCGNLRPIVLPAAAGHRRGHAHGSTGAFEPCFKLSCSSSGKPVGLAVQWTSGQTLCLIRALCCSDDGAADADRGPLRHRRARHPAREGLAAGM